jgi:hypothetical protein
MYSIGGGGGYGSWPATDAVQIFDPAANAWITETSLPVAYGTNSSDYCYDGIGMSAGGYDGLTNHAETYQGTGFPAGGAPNIVVDLTYIAGSPVPPGGGTLEFHVYVSNNEAVALDFDAWLDVEYAGVPPTTVAMRNFTNYLPGWAIDRDVFFPVPGAWAAGNYEMWGRVGGHPGTVWAEDGFPWEKSGNYDGSAFQPYVPYGFANPFDVIDKGKEELMVGEFELLDSYPNPFNPSTVISFGLKDAGIIQLTVYDISGREVAELVNGYKKAGMHEVTFDASGLASGVYIYKLTSGSQTAISKMILMK